MTTWRARATVGKATDGPRLMVWVGAETMYDRVGHLLGQIGHYLVFWTVRAHGIGGDVSGDIDGYHDRDNAVICGLVVVHHIG